MARSTEAGRTRVGKPGTVRPGTPRILNTPGNIVLQRGKGIVRWPVDTRRVRRWTIAALEMPVSLVVRLVDEPEALALNRQWGGRDAACNVLTFAYGPAGQAEALADVVVCLPVVERECGERRIGLAAHLAHLVVHGVLHAQGYTHDDDEAALRMESREASILARFGFASPYPDGS
ncbi:MAG: rRNA maturation RNase YbeY [Betaproteobacteria bacterium]